ncbi:MAG TPA: oxygen-dependent coproporphyrinogen oxidase [Planctomycetota bacterium]
MAAENSVAPVREFLGRLQDTICAALQAEDGTATFAGSERETGNGGCARPRALQGGAVIEKAAVQFTHSVGRGLPAAATARRPELAGRDYQAVSLSLIVHPRNPYAPTCHANFRYFEAGAAGAEARAGGTTPAWWFGGGFDLTPHYGFATDCRHWHATAAAACAPFGADVHARLKQACDAYFHLDHRNEARGIGGVFFDDWTEGGFDRAFGLTRALAEAFLPAYLPILAKRKAAPYGERERAFQLWRRGRYAEFNLLQDRGTRFGLQAGGPVESILASLPPLVAWEFERPLEPGSPESRLLEDFLRPRDWLQEA